MSISKEDKTDLTDINHRFLNYVSKVRHLKNEEDLSIINQSITMLEEELKILKSSYESQICQLKTSLDIIVTQKLDLEKELLSRKNNECHLNDRLMVESSKNSKLLHEVSCLKSDLSGGEQEIISLNLMIKQLRLERGDVEGKCEKMMRSLQESNAKNLKLEEKIRDYENQITCMNQKIEFQDQFFSEISYLQQQLESEIADNNQLKQANESTNFKVLEMAKQEAEFHSTIDCLRRRVDILEKALINDKQDSEKAILALQNKIKQLQQHITMEIDQARNGHSLNNNVSIRGEIEFIKRLLTEEENRLNIKPGYVHNEQINSFPHGIDFHNKEIYGSNENNGREPPQSDNFQPTRTPTDIMDFQDKNILNDNPEFVSEDEFEDENNNRYMNNISCEENLMCDSGMATQKIKECREYSLTQPNNFYMNQINQIKGSGDCNNINNSQFWSDRHEGIIAKPKIPVGPICQPENLVGPIRPVSLTPNPSNMRPPRPLSANLKGIRTKSNTSHQDSMNKDCPSRNSNHFSDSGIGQSPDYFDSLFNTKNKNEDQNEPNILDSCETSLSSLKISEVNKDGKYIKIYNSNEKYDAEIGGYTIKQNKFGHPVSLFRFPDHVKLPASRTITIWSGSNDPMLHQPPTDFFSSQPLLWGASPEFTTILCNTFGQALSWTSTPHRINPDPYRAKTAPANKDKKRTVSQRLPELIPNCFSINNEQIYLMRDDMDIVSQPIHHPFTSTPKSSIHPCVEGYRNNDISFNRQNRHQNGNMLDPMVSQQYTGTNAHRILGSAKVIQCYPPTIQSSHSLNNRMPEVLLRSSTEPPNAFQKPQSRLVTGLDQVQSMHNNFYNPRMFKTQTDSK